MELHPRLGVSVIIAHSQRVVVVKRGKAPYQGCWSLPGGAVELGETLIEAAIREALEETGLCVEIEAFLQNFDLIRRGPDGIIEGHHVLACFQARAIGGKLCAGDDADEAMWASADDLATLKLTPGLGAFLGPRLTAITGL